MLDRVVTLCRSMDPPLGPAVDAVEVEGATVIVVEIASIPRDQLIGPARSRNARWRKQ